MKTNICIINGKESDIPTIQKEVEKVAAYNELENKQKLQLLLLAEELVGMEKGILGFGEGEFYMENTGDEYRLHLHADIAVDLDVKDKFVDMSKNRKNECYKGFMGKIRFVADTFMFSANSSELSGYSTYSLNGPAMTYFTPSDYENIWSYSQYKEAISVNEPEWDELEHSIVANLADDVIVGARNNSVDMVVVKKFGKNK